ncbi:MAG: hypothetical protein LBG60_06470 [Bifidobacteriaceae bacterium]|nr:hypothetical protein [Bifidobacteriaceae bacterium]
MGTHLALWHGPDGSAEPTASGDGRAAEPTASGVTGRRGGRHRRALPTLRDRPPGGGGGRPGGLA